MTQFPREPISNAVARTARDLQTDLTWLLRWSEAEITDMERVVPAIHTRVRSWCEAGGLDVSAPELAVRLDALARGLATAGGFYLIRGRPHGALGRGRSKSADAVGGRPARRAARAE
jgi:hypothetical protein